MRRFAYLPFLFALLVSVVWLNQGLKRSDAEALAATISDPWHVPLHGARYGLIWLYERSGDEEIYQAVSSAVRGLPYDRKPLLERGHSPPPFEHPPAADGHWHAPYSEVPFEYPIAVLPFILLPSFLTGTSFVWYTRLFSAEMALVLLAACALAMRARGGGRERERGEPGARDPWMTVAWLLLAEGSLCVQRLDALPALFLALAVWAAAERRPAIFGAAIGLATSVKLLPVLLVAPLVFADRDAWATRGARARGLAGFAVAAGIGLAPMLLPPENLLGVLRYHAARGLQVESTGAALLSTWQVITGTAVPAEVSYGSFNLEGPAASIIARLAMPATFLALGAMTALLARAPAPESDGARRDRIALAALGALCALWLTAKVFSPQYLTWGLPIVLMLSPRLGAKLTLLFGAVLAVTQFNLCALYYQIVKLTPIGETALCVRLALLVAFTVAVVRGVRAGAARDVVRAVVAPGGAIAEPSPESGT